MKKLIALILAICCALPLVACGGTGAGEGSGLGGYEATYNTPGENKTQINFTVYGGGMYGTWADKLCDDFAKEHQTTKFGGGTKEGVYVKVTAEFPTVYQNLNASGQHVITYSDNNITASDLKNTEPLYNLDAVVKDTTREGGSLESNLFETIKPSIMNGGSYYGLPYLESVGGFMYNRGLFNEVGALLGTSGEPFKSDYSNNTYYMTNEDGDLAKGPDGKAGTEDDGLPASLEEMLVVMQWLRDETEKSKLYPVILANACEAYSNSIGRAMWASLAGYEQMRNFYNSQGEVEVIKRDHNGDIVYKTPAEPLFPGIEYINKPETEVITLNDDNGYKGADMAARFYAFAFMEIMMKEGFLYYDKQASHTDAQFSVMAGSSVQGYKDAAMLVDYSYAYNELLNSGNTLLLPAGKTADDYDIRYLASPTSFYTEENQQEKDVAVELTTTYFLVVNNSITKSADLEAATVEFVKFLYRQESLQYITKNSGFALPLEYGLDSMDKSGMNSYAKSMLGVRKANGSNLLTRGGTSEGYQNNKANLTSAQYMSSTTYKNIYTGVKAEGAATFFNNSKFQAKDWRV